MTAAERTPMPTTELDDFAGWTVTSTTPKINPRDKTILADLEQNGHEMLTIDAYLAGGGRGASCLVCGVEVEREGTVALSCDPRARRMEQIQRDHARWPELPIDEIIDKWSVLADIRQRMVEGAFPTDTGDTP